MADDGVLSGGQMACSMLFGTAILTYLGLEVSRLRVLLRDGVDPATRHTASKHSEPLAWTFPSLYAFFRDTAALGMVLLVAFMCEKYPIYPRGEKVWDKDMYWFLCLVLLVASLLTMKKGKCTDILNRDQTEEWKGWMQFMFLLYHYYKAEEVYNAIRIMITCYVWMTGFGNFSFFYIKEDFGIVRFVQMLWRLNFLVVLLCLSQGNTYILYYICPLHTFYFLLVFVTMRIAPHANHGKWDIRLKLLAVALFIYLVWDLFGGQIFSVLFGPVLGTAPVIGAKSGTLWEWYFRTSLDHWSTLLGMVFALNFPLATRWLTKIEELPVGQQIRVKGLTGLFVAAPFLWWATTIFPQNKLDYNTTNSYYGFIPLLAYIFFRNLTPSLRAWHSGLLHDIGKVTLETYLMQHHVWLTSNAKTLLILLPGYPKCNLVVVSVFFVYLSRQTFYITMSLRGMVLPDDRRKCITGCVATLGLLIGLVGLGWLLSAIGLGFITALLMASGAAALLLGLVHRRLNLNLWGQVRTGPSGSGGLTGLRAPSSPDSLVSLGRVVFTVCFAIFLLSLPLRPQPEMTVGGGGGAGNKVHNLSATPSSCLHLVNDGLWNDKQEWGWMGGEEGAAVASDCGFHLYSQADLTALYGKKEVAVVGDSLGRQYYFALLAGLGHPAAEAHDPDAAKHQDLSYVGQDGTKISFLWRPYVKDVAEEVGKLNTNNKKLDALVLSFGLWDTLHETTPELYEATLRTLGTSLGKLGGEKKDVKTFKAWLVPTTIVDGKLLTEEKKAHMTEAQVAELRHKTLHSELADHVDVLLDGPRVTDGLEGRSEDGVHYDDSVYSALVQIGANAFATFARENKVSRRRLLVRGVRDLDDVADWEEWRIPGEEETHHRFLKTTAVPAPKKIDGSMSSPAHGAIVLAVVILMLLTMDSYGGASVLGLWLSRADATVGWEESYEPLLSKILRSSPAPVTNSGVGSSSSTSNTHAPHHVHHPSGGAVRGRYTPVPQEVELGGVGDQPTSPSDSGPSAMNEE